MTVMCSSQQPDQPLVFQPQPPPQDGAEGLHARPRPLPASGPEPFFHTPCTSRIQEGTALWTLNIPHLHFRPFLPGAAASSLSVS